MYFVLHDDRANQNVLQLGGLDRQPGVCRKWQQRAEWFTLFLSKTNLVFSCFWQNNNKFASFQKLSIFLRCLHRAVVDTKCRFLASETSSESKKLGQYLKK